MTTTLYTARQTGPEILEKGTSNVLVCPVYRDGSLVAPSSGKLTCWNATNTKVVDDQSVTVTGGTATYTISSSTLAGENCEDGWRFEWALSLAGETVVFKRYGSLVYRRLFPPVSDIDLMRRHTDLDRLRPSSEGSFQDYLDESWNVIESRLIASGKRPWLIMSPDSLREVHTYLTLALIYRDRATGGDDSAEWKLADRYEAAFEAAWNRLTFPQADPSTGEDVSPGRKRAASPTIWLCGRG